MIELRAHIPSLDGVDRTIAYASADDATVGFPTDSQPVLTHLDP